MSVQGVSISQTEPKKCNCGNPSGITREEWSKLARYGAKRRFLGYEQVVLIVCHDCGGMLGTNNRTRMNAVLNLFRPL